jgi:hypothetical protein
LYWVENLFTRKNHQIIVSKRKSNSFYFKHCNLLFKFIFIQKCEYLNVSRLLTLKIVSLFIYYHIATLYRWLSFLWSSLSIYYLIYVVDAGKRKFIFSIFFMNLKAYKLSELIFFVYIKSCQYSMFYTNKMFWTRSQV